MSVADRIAFGAGRWLLYIFLVASLASTTGFLYGRGILPIRPEFLTLAGLTFAFGYIFAYGYFAAGQQGRDQHGAGVGVTAALPVITAYGMIVIAWLLAGFNTGTEWVGVGKHVFRPILSWLIIVVASCLAGITFVHLELRRIFIASLLIYLLSVVTDIVFPGTFAKFFARPSGFAVNANMGAEIIIILMILSVRWDRCRTSDVLIWIAGSIGVMATLSRSAAANLLLTLFIYVLYICRKWVARNIYLTLAIFAGFGVGLLIVGYSLSLLLEIFELPSSSSQRIQAILLVLSGQIGDLDLNNSRVDLAKQYFDMAEWRPILGYGPGVVATEEHGPHNMFLYLWVGGGVLAVIAGMLFFIWTFWDFVAKGNVAAVAATISLAVFCFFSHNLLDRVTFLMVWGLMPAMALDQSGSRRPDGKGFAPVPGSVSS